MSDETKSAVMGGINRSAGKVVRHNTKSQTTVLTSWDDMSACGMSKHAVENAYKQRFGKSPDEVHLNDDFCRSYGWLSYNEMGTVKYYGVEVVPKSKIGAERILTNDTDTPYTHTVTLTYNETDSATVTVKNSSSISMGASIEIGVPELGIGGSFSQSFSVSNERGSSSTQSTSVTIADTVEVEVPAHSKRKLSLVIKWEERNEDFEIPVSIQSWGLTGAQFPSRVDGHYHWAISHSSLFQPPFSSKLTGSLTASYNSTGQVVIGDVEAE